MPTSSAAVPAPGRARLVPTLGALAALLVAACAPTKVENTQSYAGPALARPDRVLVYDFAVSAADVKLDSGIGARLIRAVQGAQTNVQQVQVGREVSRAISTSLIQEIQRMGLPAQRGDGAAPLPGDRLLLIEGQVMSIDQGNRTRRTLIGFGAGQSEVEADAQVYYRPPGQAAQLVESFDAAASSGYKPGLATPLGVGAATGRAASAAVIGAGVQTYSETSSSPVAAEGARMGQEIAKRLGPFFVAQGWIAPAAIR